MTEPKSAGGQEIAKRAAARKRRAPAAERTETDELSKTPSADMIWALLNDGEMKREDWDKLYQLGFGSVLGLVPAATASKNKSVDELWSDVMESVRSIGKGDYNEDQGFRFRGVDSVVDAVGPALRQARIKVLPKRILEHHAEYYETKRGTRMVNRTVRVEWEVRGPNGDSFTGESMGEAADAGDKSLTKAQSVAYRTFLLQALNVPTGEPDPDGESHERATGPQRGSERQQWGSQGAQATAGEENQAAQPDNQEARAEMWRVAKGLGWEWDKLASRFRSDHGGLPSDQADAKTLEVFTETLLTEAEAEAAQAKSVAAEVLGGKEVQPDEAQSGGIL